MKYNRSQIMKDAWNIFRTANKVVVKINMSTALQAAWARAKAEVDNDVCEIKIAEMTGSAKQIAWAKDIISKPYNRMIAVANQYGQDLYEKEFAFVRRAAANLYKKKYEEAIEIMKSASYIIDTRFRFEVIMKHCVEVCVIGTSLKATSFCLD